MFEMTATQLVASLADMYAAAAGALWDQVVADPKLQLMVAGVLGSALVIGGLNALTRRVRHG